MKYCLWKTASTSLDIRCHQHTAESYLALFPNQAQISCARTFYVNYSFLAFVTLICCFFIEVA